MMGSSHALSGAAVWLAGSLAADQFLGYEQSPLLLAVGTATCAGAALLPDLDLSGRVITNKGGATVANTFGVASLFVAEVVEKVSLAVYKLTSLSRDPDRDNGHRTLTHTLPFAALVGWGTTALCAKFGKWAVLGILFLMIGLALRGLFEGWARRAGWLVITLLSAAAAYGTYLFLPGDRGYPLLGFAVGVGCLVHTLGDFVTRAGVPLLWPIPTGRRMWRMIGVPNLFAVRAGGPVERFILRGAFVVIAGLAATAMLGPTLAPRFEQVRAWWVDNQLWAWATSLLL